MIPPIRRVGLVGFGMIAENAYVPALKKLGVEIVAIAETLPARREAAAKLISNARLHSSHAVLIANEKNLDALIVATPPLHHADAVLAGLKAGMHILCEKPLTLDAETLTKIKSEALHCDRAVYCVNNWTFSPQWSHLFDLASGTLGTVRHAEIHVLRTRPSVSVPPHDWRRDPVVSGGGILVDHGWHALYLIRRLLGPGVRLASSILTPKETVDETATVLLSAKDATGLLHLSWRASERLNTVILVGEKGLAELRDDVLIVRANGGEEIVRFPEKLSAGSAHPEWLAAMWPSFVSECTGSRRGESLAEASFSLGVIRAAYDETKELAHA